MSKEYKTLSINADLGQRLTEKAVKAGRTPDALAADILQAHLDADTIDVQDIAEDDMRWQRYKESGHSVSQEAIRGKLRRYAAEAESKAAPQ